ncbi:quinolone resistance protein NorA [Thermococcus litoralis DSM 5473]|uniref:Quinolone resistance protein NorA n=1 Tax=Thermococcus litoralis (strain ATCC 51850 / DSM 5473 / JCM 8560 / NS-C) TaxID=523849 RepID=H3ZNQ8_THELN|nr:MFS transporter [Thermococcus litoralis]EHR78467.1 quinolone resistance protein NorA [Thermococcus litoralis DSM 5473]
MKRKDLWLLHFSTLFFFLGYILVAPLISPLAITFGASPFLVGFVASVSSIFAFVLKPVGGILGDKGKSFEVMMIGTILGAVAGGFYLLSFFMRSLTIFAIGRAVHGAASAFFFPSSLSTAINLAPKGRVGETLGWRETMFSLSQLIGPAVGGLVADYFGFHSAFVLAILFSLVGFLFVSNAYREVRAKIPVKESEEKKGSYRDLVNLSFVGASISLFFMVFAYSGMYTFLPAYYKILGLGTSIFGIYASIMGGFSLLTRVFGGREADKRGPIPVASSGLLLITSAYVALFLYLLPPEAYLSAVILGMGFGLAVPSLQMLALANLPKNIRGIGSSVYTMFFDLGYLSGPLALGYLAEIEGYEGIFLFLPMLTFLSLSNLILLKMLGRKRP